MTTKHIRTTSRGELVYTISGTNDPVWLTPVVDGYKNQDGVMFATPEAACEAYLAEVVAFNAKRNINANASRCHYCGQQVGASAKPNMLGVYQCKECR